MKTHATTFITASFLALVASFGLYTCGMVDTSKDAMEILRRVPNDNILLVSIRPSEIFESQLVQIMLERVKDTKEFKESTQHFQEELGLNLQQDVERILVMSNDLKSLPHSACILMQGNMKPFNSAIDSALAFDKVRHQVHSIEGWKVNEIHAPNRHDGKHNPGTIFVYNDDTEIIATPRISIMQRMLAVKKRGGETLANNRDFIRQFHNLKYTRHAWGIVQVGGLMDDILKKVREKKPDLNIHKLAINELQGGVYLTDAVGISFEAYCPDRDQVTLLYEAANGFLAFGKLTFGSFPEMRKILDGIEILKIDDRVVVNSMVSLDDLTALEKLKEL